MKLIFKFKGLLKKRSMQFATEEEANDFIKELEEKNLIDFGKEVLNCNSIKSISKRF